ncbi:hypothetical protein QFC21_001329 [Naganishia friedmannii]|uniref:Uncharacterized protein n=1 Tax=Naganishia friedmannii TaxID=89922 RepID=A0ACC2W4Y0_9TREE|nr:hypothetical protein QFC21_001329 [Naganishia friedmannii]
MRRRTISPPAQQSWHIQGGSRVLDSKRPSLDSADDATSAQQYRQDEQNNDHQRRGGGMSRSSSEGPPLNSHEPGLTSATEAARSRSFRALRTAKACDQNHEEKIIITFRKQNGQSVIPKNTRGRPMTTDIGNWAIRQQSSDIAADNVAGPILSCSGIPGAMHSKRRRHSSSSDDRVPMTQAHGVSPSARTQLPVLDPNLVPSAFYQDVARGGLKEARTFEISDTRFPYVASSAANHATQPPIDAAGLAMSQSGQPLFTTYKDISDAYTLPRISDTTQASSSKTKDTPSSVQAISAGLISATTTFSTPRSGSGQSGVPGVTSLDYSAEYALYGGPEETRTGLTRSRFTFQAAHIGGYDTVLGSHSPRQQPVDHNSSAYSTSTQRHAGDRDNTRQAWLRSQRRPDTIFGAEADALGNAGITTVQRGAGVNGVLWWARGQVEPQIDPDLMTMAPEGGNKDNRNAQSNTDDARSNFTVWRWGCDKLMAYVVTIHTMYPVMDIDEVRGSISVAYAGGVDYRPDQGPQLNQTAKSLHQARNLMVLALGAQIEGGDGDAHCCTRIEQYLAIGHASRLVLSLGLHRDSTCRVHQSEDQGLRVVFWTTYVLEKTISLWQGRPSCLNIQGEIDTVLPLSDKDGKINALRTVVDLVDFVDSVQAIYFNHDRDASRISAIDKVNEVFEELETLRRSVPREMLDFQAPDPDSPGSLLALDTPEGEMALFKFRLCLLYHNIRMLATLPLLSYLVWQDVTKQPFTANPEAVRIAAECVSSAESTSKQSTTMHPDLGLSSVYGSDTVFAIRESVGVLRDLRRFH